MSKPSLISVNGPAEVRRKMILDYISPDMTVDEAFYKQVYSEVIMQESFLSEAAARLAETGRKDAIQGYNAWFAEYQTKQDAALKPVAKWLRERIDNEYERKFGKHEERKGEESRKKESNLQNLTRSELTELCQRLLKEGVIKTPEQFLTLAGCGQ